MKVWQTIKNRVDAPQNVEEIVALVKTILEEDNVDSLTIDGYSIEWVSIGERELKFTVKEGKTE
jgi:hypothetical protein